MRKPSHQHAEGFPAGLLPFLFLTTLAVYINTLGPALFRNDSPETITACVTLGVSHPPSYPLHTLLGRLFSFIALGNPAMTLNLFAAFLGSVGVCLFALNLWIFLSEFTVKAGTITNRIPLIATCLAGSFSFAFSKSYWSASLTAKGGIYVLQIVLELGLLLCLQFWIKSSGSRNFLNVLIFVFSLGFINHWPTQMLLVPAISLLVLVRLLTGDPGSFKHFRWKQLLFSLTFPCLVASLYLYLPLRSHLYPRLNFGVPFTFLRFIDSLFRTSYFKVETLASFVPMALSTIQEKAVYISDHFLNEFDIWFLALSLLGVFAFLKRGRKEDLLFLLLVLLTTLVTNLIYLQVLPIEYWHLDDHLLTLNWVTALLSSTGLFFLFSYFLKQFTHWRNQALPLAEGTLLLCFFPISTLFGNLLVNDQKTEFLFHGYGIGLMRSMEKSSLYFAESDYDYFSLLYLEEVERKRSDLRLFLVPFLSKDYEYSLLQKDQKLKPIIPSIALMDQPGFFQWIGNPLNGSPIYCAFSNGPFQEMFLRHNPSLSFRPEGLTIRIHPPGEASPSRRTVNLLDEFWVRYLMFYNRSPNHINRLFLELCAYPYLNMAQYLRFKGDWSAWDALNCNGLKLILEEPWLADEWARRAEEHLFAGEKSAAIGDYEASALGYGDAQLTEKSLMSLQKALALDPKNENIRQHLAESQFTPK